MFPDATAWHANRSQMAFSLQGTHTTRYTQPVSRSLVSSRQLKYQMSLGHQLWSNKPTMYALFPLKQIRNRENQATNRRLARAGPNASVRITSEAQTGTLKETKGAPPGRLKVMPTPAAPNYG